MKEQATQIVKKLQENGYTAYFAGGAVRDSLLGLTPKDYDVATNATPDEVEKLFNNTKPVGKHFGVILVEFDQFSIEIATFRKDSLNSDGRRPESVEFLNSAKEDAKRRDFTINGMFFDPIADKLIDYVGGEEDLKNGIIRTIGDPVKRFEEDYLRILRALRFAARFDYKIEAGTEFAIYGCAHKLCEISKERRVEEFLKICSYNNRNAFEKLFDYGVIFRIFSEFNLFELMDDKFISSFCSDIKVSAEIRLGYLLQNSKNVSQKIKDCGFSNEFALNTERVIKIVNELRKNPYDNLYKAKKIIADPLFGESFWLVASRVVLYESGSKWLDVQKWNEFNKKYPKLPNRLLSGDEIIQKTSLTEGKELGIVIQKLWKAQLNEEINSKEEALELANNIINN